MTGHSQDPNHWHILTPDHLPELLVDLDKDIDYNDVTEALKVMKRHKAPEKDSIPTDFLQACACKTFRETQAV